MESRRDDRRYSKLSTEMEPTCFWMSENGLPRNHCNINPKAKEIQEDLTVVGNTSSCSCRTGIDYPKLRMEEEEEDDDDDDDDDEEEEN